MQKPSPFALLVTAVLAAALIIGSSLTLRIQSLSDADKALVSLLPVPAFVVLVVLMMRQVARLDGLLQRIALEAVTFAATTTGLMALTYGQLERVELVPHLNPGFIMAALLVTYSIGYSVSSRRYR
jgi:hypothetical protein